MTAWIASIGVRAWTWLAGIGAVLLAVAAIFARGRATGRRAAEHEQLQQRVHAAQERANADRDADRSNDPAGELRRDWRRGL
jgi:hypothetical protein